MNRFFAAIIPWNTLRQRIFTVILGVVILSQAVFLAEIFIQRGNLEDRRKRTAASFERYIFSVINGKDMSILEYPLQFYNTNGPQLWIERLDGTVVTGVPVAGFTYAEREALPPPMTPMPHIRIWQAILDWETGPDSRVELLVAPINLKEGQFLFCFVYSNHMSPFFYNYFPWGLLILLLTGIILSFIFANHLTKPLRQLQDGVLGINGDNLADPLPVDSPGEIADVTRAVNSLKSSLAQHMRGMHELMANVSHEIRSPLTRMNLAAACIDEGIHGAYKHIEGANHASLMACADPLALALKYASYLKEDLAHMEKIVSNTLLSSRLDLWKEVNLHPIDFSRLCNEAVDGYTLIAQEKELQLASNIDKGIFILADETLIRQVVFNLLDNAITYCNGRPQINIRLEAGAKVVKLSVENPCLPMQEEKMQRIFEPFYRAGRKDGTGVGLGLSLVNKIIRLHGGKLSARYAEEVLRIDAFFNSHFTGCADEAA
jgi:signal transduction histidine kinase